MNITPILPFPTALLDIDNESYCSEEYLQDSVFVELLKAPDLHHIKLNGIDYFHMRSLTPAILAEPMLIAELVGACSPTPLFNPGTSVEDAVVDALRLYTQANAPYPVEDVSEDSDNADTPDEEESFAGATLVAESLNNAFAGISPPTGATIIEIDGEGSGGLAALSQLLDGIFDAEPSNSTGEPANVRSSESVSEPEDAPIEDREAALKIRREELDERKEVLDEWEEELDDREGVIEAQEDAHQEVSDAVIAKTIGAPSYVEVVTGIGLVHMTANGYAVACPICKTDFTKKSRSDTFCSTGVGSCAHIYKHITSQPPK